MAKQRGQNNSQGGGSQGSPLFIAPPPAGTDLVKQVAPGELQFTFTVGQAVVNSKNPNKTNGLLYINDELVEAVEVGSVATHTTRSVRIDVHRCDFAIIKIRKAGTTVESEPIKASLKLFRAPAPTASSKADGPFILDIAPTTGNYNTVTFILQDPTSKVRRAGQVQVFVGQRFHLDGALVNDGSVVDVPASGMRSVCIELTSGHATGRFVDLASGTTKMGSLLKR